VVVIRREKPERKRGLINGIAMTEGVERRKTKEKKRNTFKMD